MLGVTTAAAMVVGNMIGSGIFVKPGVIAQELGRLSADRAGLGVGRAAVRAGRLVFRRAGGDAAARVGGLYVYLREAYGQAPPFCLAGTRFCSTGRRRPAPFHHLRPFAVSHRRADGWKFGRGALPYWHCCSGRVNIRGVAWVARCRLPRVGVKVGFLVVWWFCCLCSSYRWAARSGRLEHWTEVRAQLTPVRLLVTRFGVVLSAVMWAYNGWHAVGRWPKKIRRPERNIPSALSVELD